MSYYDYLDDYRFMHPEEFDDAEENEKRALKEAEVIAKILNNMSSKS
jgi:hypothetical protein